MGARPTGVALRAASTASAVRSTRWPTSSIGAAAAIRVNPAVPRISIEARVQALRRTADSSPGRRSTGRGRARPHTDRDRRRGERATPRRRRRGTGRRRARGTNPNSASSQTGVDATRLGPGHRRPAVSIGDHHQAGPQRRDDDLLDPLGEVGGVQQRGLDRVGVTVPLGRADEVAAELRARQRCPGHAAAGVAQVLLEPPDMGRAAGPIDALEDEQHTRLAVGTGVRGRHRWRRRSGRPGVGRGGASCAGRGRPGGIEQRPDAIPDGIDPHAGRRPRVEDEGGDRPRTGIGILASSPS